MRLGRPSSRPTLPIRKTLETYSWPSEFKYEVFLQGPYLNDTNLGGDSDVDVVVRLAHQLKPRVVGLRGKGLEEDDAHRAAHERWRSFRRLALRAMREWFGMPRRAVARP